MMTKFEMMDWCIQCYPDAKEHNILSMIDQLLNIYKQEEGLTLDHLTDNYTVCLENNSADTIAELKCLGLFKMEPWNLTKRVFRHT
eukprot:UN18621